MPAPAIYYGLNALSNNMIMADRKRLRTPNGVILGTPGSGKSFSAKREILSCFLITKDDIIICDPEGEYVFQMVTFPIIIISSKLMIDEIIPEKLKSSGQMAAMSVYMGLSLLIMPVFCSWLSEAIGCDPALLVVAGFAVPAIVLILMFKKARGPLQKKSQNSLRR